MKTASKVMYTIGRIFNILAMIGFLIVLIMGIVAIAKAPDVAAQADATMTVEEARAAGITLTTVGAIFVAVYCIIFVLATHASKALNNDKKENAPHVLMIIIGVFGDIFYLLGGIFGLVAESENSNKAE